MANANANTPKGTNPFEPTRLITTTSGQNGAVADALYPPQGPVPSGTTPAEVNAMERGAGASPTTGPGVEGEQVLWEATYSMKNFLGRIAFRVALTIAWVALAVETWGRGNGNLSPITIGLGVALVVLWVMLVYRMAQARYGHFYRLSNRRLFVSTGLMRRRRDQMELLRVKDVYTRQSLVERWLSLGTVIVISSEKEMPTFYITGVDDPKQVMDLIWNAARSERDHRSTNIHSV